MRLILLVFILLTASCKLRNPIAPSYRTITPRLVRTLADTMKHSSGLIFWDDAFWTHNDTKEEQIFRIDTAGRLLRIVNVYRTRYGNWEDMAQDAGYIYIANTGNNTDGVRRNLSIYRIAKADLLHGDTAWVKADTIRYRYKDQTDFHPRRTEDTDFDCEALMAYGDSLYLFMKQWNTPGTTVYALPKKPGDCIAHASEKYRFDGLITGASCLPGSGIVALCGYTTNRLTYLNPFVLLLYGYHDRQFFSGHIKRFEIDAPFHQVEAIALTPSGRCYITNEGIDQFIMKVSPKLMEIKLPAQRD